MKIAKYCVVGAFVALGCSSGSQNESASNSEVPASNVASALQPTVAVSLLNGNRFEVYEPTPGDLVFSESGKEGTPKTNLDAFKAKSLRGLLEALPLAEAVPESVDAADKRHVEFLKTPKAVRDHSALREVNTTALPTTDELAPKMSEAAFRSQFCGEHYEWDVACNSSGINCWPNSTNDYTYYKGDINSGYVAVNAWRGTVTLRVRTRPWFTWSTAGQWEVPSDSWRWVERHSVGDSEIPCNNADFDFEAAIFNAAGDGYHLTTQWSTY